MELGGTASSVKKMYKINGRHHERSIRQSSEHKTMPLNMMGKRFISMRCIFQVLKIHIDSAQGPYTTAETFSIFNLTNFERYS
jgi:hypothetical protein